MSFALRVRNALRSSAVAQTAYSRFRGLYRNVRYPLANGRRILRTCEQDPPRSLKIELTNICNANCIFCGYQYETRAKGVMPADLYTTALEQYREMGGRSVHFTPVVGEPLVDPDFVDRVELAVNMGFETVSTFTNGVLLEDHDLERLLSLGISRLHVSTSGFDADEYARIFRNRHYSKLLRGLRGLLETNQRLGNPVPIRIELRSDKPLNEVLRQRDYREHIEPFVGGTTQVAYLFDYDNWGGMIDRSDLIGVMRLAQVPRSKKAPCFRTYSCMVMWDGRVRACSCRFSFRDKVDGLLIGDLRQASLQEIWWGEAVTDLRLSFLHNRIPNVCKSCAWYVPGDHGKDRQYWFA